MKWRISLNVNWNILFALSIVFACLTACDKEPVSPPPPVTASPPPTASFPKTFLSLGDSYSIGSSVSVEDRFPIQTRNLLVQAGLQVSSPNILAVSGWTTGNLLFSLSQSPPPSNYDIVTLLIGVNNQYQGRTQEEYKTEFSSLLQKAISYAGSRKNRVFVLSIPDYSVTPFAQRSDTAKISRDIDAFNAINKQISLAAGVFYLDITAISREARYDQSLTAVDVLHPSGKQYARWAMLLAPLIQSAL